MKKKTTEALAINDSALAQEFAQLEQVVQEEIRENFRIDADIKALQSKLKKMDMGLLENIFVTTVAGSELTYNVANNFFYIATSDEDAHLLTSAKMSVKREMHTKYLPDLVRKIKDEYMLQKELEKEAG